MDNWLLSLSLALLVTYGLGNDTEDVPECMTNDECASDRVCAKQTCMDPCIGACGPHTVCHVKNHVSMCSCSPGHSGHPLLGCSPTAEVPSCSGHDNCPATKACIQGRCEDPCDGLCGDNTTCTVRNHIPACACKDGYTGNAFHGCTEQQAVDCPSPLSERCATACTILEPALGTWPPLVHGKKQFYFENTKKVDWQSAFISCLMNNSRLATVESEEELAEIINLTRPYWLRSYWTSGTDHGHEGKHIWASSGKPLSMAPGMWHPNQPDNYRNSEHCVIYQTYNYARYGLNDLPCENKEYYICEYYS